jgi:hypothetical protein
MFGMGGTITTSQRYLGMIAISNAASYPSSD